MTHQKNQPFVRSPSVRSPAIVRSPAVIRNSGKKAPLYKDSSAETISFSSPKIIPRFELNETPMSTRKITSASSPSYSTSSSIRSPIGVRKNVWTNRNSDTERQMNWLNGAAKRDQLHFEENNLIINSNLNTNTNANNHKQSDEEQSSKICLLLKTGSISNHSGNLSFTFQILPN